MNSDSSTKASEVVSVRFICGSFCGPLDSKFVRLAKKRFQSEACVAGVFCHVKKGQGLFVFFLNKTLLM